MLPEPRELDEEPNSDVFSKALNHLNVTEEIRNTEEELRTQNKEMVDILGKERTDNAMESERHADIIKEYETKEEDRRIRKISAIEISRDIQEQCRNLKDQNVSTQDRETSERIFHEPIESLRQKKITNNLTDNSGQDFGETAKALGGNDFLKEIQHNYEEAGKPICSDLE